MAGLIPKNVVGVAESGIEKGADVARLRAAGYQAFLIGETLMKSKSPGEALRVYRRGGTISTQREDLASSENSQLRTENWVS